MAPVCGHSLRTARRAREEGFVARAVERSICACDILFCLKTLVYVLTLLCYLNQFNFSFDMRVVHCMLLIFLATDNSVIS